MWNWLLVRLSSAAAVITGRPIIALRAKATRVQALDASALRIQAARAKSTRIQSLDAEY